MSIRYAKDTEVSSSKSKTEIETLLIRAGADQFANMSSAGKSAIVFTLGDRRYQFVLPLPDRGERRFTHTQSRGIKRSNVERDQVYEQAIRSKWRALALCIKSKLISVTEGVESLEVAFFAHLVVPGTGKTTSELLLPQVQECYKSGKPLPPLIPEST